MSRHLENLQRMFGKMQSRYGADDAIVSQFKQEVESCESAESVFRELPTASLGGTPGSAAVMSLRDIRSKTPICSSACAQVDRQRRPAGMSGP